MKTQIALCLSVLALTQCGPSNALVGGEALPEPEVTEDAGHDAGEDAGRDSGCPLAEGADQLLEQGRIEGLRAAIVVVLTAHSVEVSEDARARVASSTDDALLKRWLVRASAATSETEVFAGDDPR